MTPPAVTFPAAAFRRRFNARAVFCAATVLAAGCGEDSAAPPAPEESRASAAPIFEDMAAATGLVFEHSSGASGRFYMPEIMGSGIALLDYDGDDDLDVFVLQGKPLEPGKADAAGTAGPRHRLFRNELNPAGELRFVDVSDGAGINDTGYGMGLAVGDIDNDGDPDLYLANFGPNALYINQGDGSFTLAPEAGM